VTGGTPNSKLQKAGAMFGLLAAFFAWYVALAGIADDSNRYVCFVLFFGY
jgi:succinate-acetate transporter protein